MRLLITLAALLALAGCAGQRSGEPVARAPAEVKAEIVRLMPAKVPDREGWATDIYAAFAAQHISPTTQNLCSVLAVAEQESTYQVDPTVPGLGKIARDEIDRRAAKVHIPGLLVSGALQVRSTNGKTYSERLSAARSEKNSAPFLMTSSAGCRWAAPCSVASTRYTPPDRCRSVSNSLSSTPRTIHTR